MKEYKTKAQKKRFYKSKAWQIVRRAALMRDNFECQECKRLGRVTTIDPRIDKHKQLDVDHVLEIEEYPEKALELDNLRTLCVRCHNDKHGRVFKRQPRRWEHDERW